LKEELMEDFFLIGVPLQELEEELVFSVFLDKIGSFGNFLQHFSYNFYD